MCLFPVRQSRSSKSSGHIQGRDKPFAIPNNRTDVFGRGAESGPDMDQPRGGVLSRSLTL
jgi:hypothetical protein